MISDSFSPPTSTAPNTTILLYRLHPLVLYLQSSPRSWTVCATTKKQLQSGLTARTQNVPAWPSDNMQPLLINLINTWFSMETAYTSPMHPLHPLLRAHFRTKSSHPPRKYIHPFARLCGHGLPGTHSLHYQKHIDELWQRSIHSHYTALHNHITHKDITRFKQLFPEAIFHNEDKRATSLRIYCPVIYFQCLTKTFADPLVFRKLEDNPNDIIEKTIAEITKHFGKSYPWALGAGRDLPNAYVLPKRKKQFLAGRPIVSFFTAPFRPMLNCIAKMIYNLLLQAFPHNLAKGDVFDLIQLLKNTDFDNLPTPRIHNQDLAGFFTSIDTDRFIDSWRLTLQFLSTIMSTDPDEIISAKATPGNTTGDVVKGRTCRTLNDQEDLYS